MSGAPRFEMRGIRKAFGGTVALGGVDLSVRAGEVCALVGPNGAGKSTLMAILSGALAPDEGVMALEGAPYRPRDPLEARRAGVAMIHQELSLAPHLSVADNIVLGMEPARWGLVRRAEARARAERALGGLQHGEIDPDAPVGTLGPAAQQLVEIARAFAVGCRVLVLDEPTSSLGQEDVRRLFDLVRRLRDEGQAVVYISHFLEEVQQVADRFVVLRDGRNAGEGPVAGATRDEIVALMIGPPGRRDVRAQGAPAGARSSWRPRTWSRAAPASTCAEARCWASPGSWAPGARACCARCSGWSPCARDASAWGCTPAPPRRPCVGTRAWAS